MPESVASNLIITPAGVSLSREGLQRYSMPCSVNLTAFPTKFVTGLARRPGSPRNALGTAAWTSPVMGRGLSAAPVPQTATAARLPRWSGVGNRGLQFQFAGFDFAAFQHVIDRRQLRFAALLNRLGKRALLFGQGRPATGYHTDHAVHGRAQPCVIMAKNDDFARAAAWACCSAWSSWRLLSRR